MDGPYPAGRYTPLTAANQHGTFRHLRAGRRYRVVQAFTDYDAAVHPVDEAWVFLGVSYAPYDGGTSLFVSLDGAQEWHVRLQNDEQEAVLENLAAYIAEADGG